MIIHQNYLNKEPLYHSEKFKQYFIYDFARQEIIDYYCTRPTLTVFSNIDNSSDFFSSTLRLIAYISDLHMNKLLFHGDIKPANIFISLRSGFMSSDCGTLIPLDNTTEE